MHNIPLPNSQKQDITGDITDRLHETLQIELSRFFTDLMHIAERFDQLSMNENPVSNDDGFFVRITVKLGDTLLLDNRLKKLRKEQFLTISSQTRKIHACLSLDYLADHENLSAGVLNLDVDRFHEAVKRITPPGYSAMLPASREILPPELRANEPTQIFCDLYFQKEQ